MAIADLTDATPDTSSEEIAAFAEQVAKEVEADRKGETKSDAQITNEQAGTQQPADKTIDTPFENDTGSDSASEVEETGYDTESPEWLTDDVKAEAAAYGIDES